MNTTVSSKTPTLQHKNKTAVTVSLFHTPKQIVANLFTQTHERSNEKK
jgi:hypothetical protein